MNKKIAYLLLIALLLPVFTACNGAAADGPLPHAMKGYELYSWQEGADWHFTLITGTNRNKTLDEIISGESVEGEDGWVNIHVTGVDAIKNVLKRVPSGEFVSWSSGWGVALGTQTENPLTTGTRTAIKELSDLAKERGFTLTVY
ncbi:MAG: hypothetical protein WC370_08280 [Dehalococcoidales bacterium]|jgi:hypothetical protein